MSKDSPLHDTQAEWVHVEFPEQAAFKSVYGFAGSLGTIHLEGVRYVPKGVKSRTLLVFMHPATTLQLLPMPRALAARGLHVLCAGSRYARNDSALIMENVAVDLGAYIRHARETWGYEKIVLMGWSGGGSLSLFYQSQAERPTITHTPAGDPCAITTAGLIPADAMIFQAAHVSRAVTFADWIDPSVVDENDPDRRDPELDLYHPDRKPPYSAEFLARFRAAQLARIRRRTAWVKETLETLKKRGGKEMERGFVTHRTMAEPRFLDGAIDPNDRPIGTCFMGVPETANNGPIGLARFSTLRSWLSQWSPDDTNAHGEKCAAGIHVPLLAIEHSADDAVPQPHTRRIFDAAASADKSMTVIRGANHYFVGQPEHLQQAGDLCMDWLRQRGLLD
ncbi:MULTISPECIES: alpha/beta hydrolase [unclassified Pigmentiphaga]|jgi:dienelactone hydrolase|uniref:alpha/beta hydrolase family protein n=1 Tax=unclassified Pigmentiphaga TaxID=2626614 RepID=UPI000B41A42F|nr:MULTISPECIES: alpha/beta hydrolase [unclassified Pigmentiphaga]OVZ63241.1 alpha/beta hydrolase [Pigmentiphaga sp. NML030171]